MQITVTIANPQPGQGDLVSLEALPNTTIETLQEFIQAETTIAPADQILYYDGNLITDKSNTLEQLQINSGEMIVLHIRERGAAAGGDRAAGGRAQQAAGGAAAAPGASASAGARSRRPGEPDPEMIRLQILGDPRLREEAVRQQPQLASVLDDPVRFAQFFNESYERDRRERAERQRQIAQLNADPFDIEAQARIEEIIRQERVMENLQNAMEHNPEVFGRVHLLYVDVEVNGYKVKALVDSGAQATIMSPSCAEACGIMRLIDRRFAGVARGVGTANIIGRVHSAQIRIGSLFLPCSFTVMEGKAVELLIGLDMLKRHQASIDLAKDRLIIQGVEIPFLGEADIPKESEEALSQEPTIPGPSGTTIGQRSGAVLSGEGEEGGQPGAAAAGAGGTAAAQAGQPSQQQQQQTQAHQPLTLQQQQQPSAQAAVAGQSAGIAAAPAAQPPQQAASATAAGGAVIQEESIQQLMALGFPREAAIQSLQATGGNVEYAASLLFQG